MDLFPPVSVLLFLSLQLLLYCFIFFSATLFLSPVLFSNFLSYSSCFDDHCLFLYWLVHWSSVSAFLQPGYISPSPCPWAIWALCSHFLQLPYIGLGQLIGKFSGLLWASFITLAAWNQSWREYLYHGNWWTLWSLLLYGVYHHITICIFFLGPLTPSWFRAWLSLALPHTSLETNPDCSFHSFGVSLLG